MKYGLFLFHFLCGAAELSNTNFPFQYDQFFFDSNYATLAWSRPRGCAEPYKFMLVKTLPQGSVIKSNQGDNTTIKIPRFDSLVNTGAYKIHIVAIKNYSICGISEISLQIPQELITTKNTTLSLNDFCIMPPSPLLTVIWPKSDNKLDGSCSCTIWTRISRCDCLQRSNFYGVYNDVRDGNQYICWKNITNNTLIHVALESNVFTDPNITSPRVNQEIMMAMQIVIPEIPGSPIVEVPSLESDNQTCFLWLSEVYDGNTPVLNYSILIIENTGYMISVNVNKDIPKTCGLTQKINPNCGPLNITVQSQNKVGLSTPTIKIVYDNKNMNICQCINDNVQLNISIQKLSNPQMVQLLIICDSKYTADKTFGIYVELWSKESRKLIYNTLANCSMDILLQSLEYSTTYELYFKWLSRSGNNCTLINTVNEFTTDSQTSNHLLLVIGIVVGVVGVVVGILLCIGFVYCCVFCVMECCFDKCRDLCRDKRKDYVKLNPEKEDNKLDK